MKNLILVTLLSLGAAAPAMASSVCGFVTTVKNQNGQVTGYEVTQKESYILFKRLRSQQTIIVEASDEINSAALKELQATNDRACVNYSDANGSIQSVTEE
jgi:hypothetical protein